MKLSELLERKMEAKIINKPIKILFKKKLLGTGCQSLVYDLENGFVCKVFPIISENDPSYQFIRLASNNQNNRYFPKIKSIKIYNYLEIGEEDQEILIDMDYYNINPKHKKIVVVVIEKLFKNENLVRTKISTILGRTGQFDLKQFRMDMETVQGRYEIKKESTDKIFSNALRLLEPLFNKFESDMHENNIMVRKNGDLVLVDPVAPRCDVD